MDQNNTDIARKLIRDSMKSIRSMTPSSNQKTNRVFTTDIRSGVLNGNIVNRLIIHLHSSGCGWARNTGGCTMCGFFAATTTGLPISAGEFQEQVSNVLYEHDPNNFQVIALYNAGNILNEEEMPFVALENICHQISKYPNVLRVSIESRPEYIDPEKLRILTSILSGKEIELGIGVETTNEIIRDLCINKTFSNQQLEKNVQYLLSLGITPKAYLLLKPPFITEKEMIDDFLLSYWQLIDMGINRIDCETMTIEAHTLVYQLWKNRFYRTPWLWSIIHILEQLQGMPIYFTPFRYIVDSIEIAHNCNKCSPTVKNQIFEFQDGKVSFDSLRKLNCECKREWIEEQSFVDERLIENRIIDTMKSMVLDPS